MVNLIEIAVSVLIFFCLQYIAYLWTEKNTNYPEWLKYPPYMCRKCAQFWLCMGFYLSTGITLQLWIFMAVGIALTILNTIALIIDQKKKTIIV